MDKCTSCTSSFSVYFSLNNCAKLFLSARETLNPKITNNHQPRSFFIATSSSVYHNVTIETMYLVRFSQVYSGISARTGIPSDWDKLTDKPHNLSWFPSGFFCKCISESQSENNCRADVANNGVS